MTTFLLLGKNGKEVTVVDNFDKRQRYYFDNDNLATKKHDVIGVDKNKLAPGKTKRMSS